MIYDPDEALQHELADFPRCRLEICRSAEYVSASPSQHQPGPASTSQAQPGAAANRERAPSSSAASLHHGAEQSLIMTATFY